MAKRPTVGVADDLDLSEVTLIIPTDDDVAAPAVDQTTDFQAYRIDETVETSAYEYGAGRRAYETEVGANEITQDIVVAELEFDEPELEVQEAPDVLEPLPQGVKQRGKHRIAAPPHSLRGRTALVAVAAGATAAALTGHFASHHDAAAPVDAPITPAGDAPAGLLTANVPTAAVKTPTDTKQFRDGLGNGLRAAAAAEAIRERNARPLYGPPVQGAGTQISSIFGARDGGFHWGVDFTNGGGGAPIYAAQDGVVVESGPASGFGHWIVIKGDDGDYTVYGHEYADGLLVNVGDRVRAGDHIGNIGSDGESSGPHCHFEVWKNGTTKVDPIVWLAEHGVNVPRIVG